MKISRFNALPNPNIGDVAWQKGQAAVTNQYDYFTCGGARARTAKKESFDYPGSGSRRGVRTVSELFIPSGPADLHRAVRRMLAEQRGHFPMPRM